MSHSYIQERNEERTEAFVFIRQVSADKKPCALHKINFPTNFFFTLRQMPFSYHLKYFFSKKPIENARQLLKRRRFKFWRQILYIQNGLKVQNSCAACRGRGGEFAVCHLETGKWQTKRLRDIK